MRTCCAAHIFRSCTLTRTRRDEQATLGCLHAPDRARDQVYRLMTTPSSGGH
jgi:hypothetical protein